MKKFVTILCCLCLCLTIKPENVFAKSSQSSIVSESNTNEKDKCINATLVSVTRQYKGGITINSISKPTKTWDLATQGTYDWYATSHGSVIYSNYLFTNHNGAVHIQGYENSGNKGTFSISIYVSDTLFDTVYTYSCNKGQWFFIDKSGLSSKNKVYFTVKSGDGNLTSVINGLFSSLN